MTSVLGYEVDISALTKTTTTNRERSDIVTVCSSTWYTHREAKTSCP